MNQDPAIPLSLLVHDGELGDVRALLDEIGTPYVERCGGLESDDRGTSWALVIATPKRILDLHLHPAVSPAKIAVMSQDSRTLRNSLRRHGIELLVRRPVHPATLRALVVHALYQGPEKRRTARVNVGAPVLYRAGWRQRPALLMDLSLGGCRLLIDRQLERGAPLTLALPAEIAGGKAFNVKGEVLHSNPDASGSGGRFVTAARFTHPGKRQNANLKTAIAAHAQGPAVFEGAPPLSSVEPAADAAPPTIAEPASSAAPPASSVPASSAKPSASSVPASSAAPPACGEPACAAPHPTPTPAISGTPGAAPTAPRPAPMPAPEERRTAPRHTLDQRVVSLAEEAARVLMGRDITIGGMRVDRHPALELGSDVQLAVHTTTRDTPLIVRAKVHRDNGDRGMVLRFHALSPDATRYLNEVMDNLPLADADEEGEGCLVTEILEAM
jgi:hypothetical protein